MFRIGICDDEKSACAELENLIHEFAKERSIEMDVTVWHTGESLCDSLQKEPMLDLLFLDIELISTDGPLAKEEIQEVLGRSIVLSEKKNRFFEYVAKGISYGEQLVGIVRATLWEESGMVKDVKTVCLDDIDVVPAYRRKGIATKLYAEVEPWAKEQGAIRLKLHIWDFNKGALYVSSYGYDTPALRVGEEAVRRGRFVNEKRN